MIRVIVAALLVFPVWAGGDGAFELAGNVHSDSPAAISLFGATTPYAAYTTSDASGRFTFKKLEAGDYTLAVFIPARGEARQTVEIGPGTADSRGRVSLDLHLKDSDFVFQDAMRREHSVSAAQLSVPDKAVREFEDGERELGRHNVDAAVRDMEEAVRIAPQFSAAWNNLGTINYQTQKFDRAEECFRNALKADPRSFEALVNLGGVLVTVHKLDEAWQYNSYAVMSRPNDALANAQMGQTYFQLNNYELALKYLERARQIDPTHFSKPQLFIAEIHLRQGDTKAAAGALQDFLKHHPDWPQKEKMEKQIAAWLGQ